LDLNRKGRDLETAKKELSLQGAFSDVRHLLGAEENHPRNIELLWRLADRANARIAQ
jgi:hypothetical protein